MKKPIFKLCLFYCALSLTAPEASAAPLTPLAAGLYYEAGFSGINFGKAGIEISAEPEKATVTCDIMSAGILALFVKHSSHTVLAATGKDFSYPDRIYESHYKTRKKARSVKLTYKNGKITESAIYPPESKDKRPEVPEADKNSAFDLMSFLLQIRKELAKAQESGNVSFSINAFDGRRLSRADFTVAGETIITVGGKKKQALVITSRRTPLAGFTDGEKADRSPNEPSMTSYFSKDEKLIPLRMEIPFLIGKITADLVKECSNQESCLLGNSE